jgi:AcrR family transcriptional regulator
MRDKILESAAKIFSQKGYHKASMDEIAADAGVAKGSLYYHFQNKSQLFKDVAVYGMEDLRNELQKTSETTMPIEEKVAAVIDRITSLCFDYSDLFNIIMSEASEGVEPDAWQQIQQTKSSLLEYISNLLREGCEYEHIIRPLDFELTTHALMSFIYTYRKQSLARGRGDKEKMLREIHEIVMHGIVVY